LKSSSSIFVSFENQGNSKEGLIPFILNTNQLNMKNLVVMVSMFLGMLGWVYFGSGQ